MLKVRTAVMNGTFEQDHIALTQPARGLRHAAEYPNFETVSSQTASSH
jgi:hypothetical protein